MTPAQSSSQIDIHRVTMIFDLLSSFQQNIRIVPAKLLSAVTTFAIVIAHLDDQRPIPTFNPRQRIIAPLLLHRQIELTIPTPTLLLRSQKHFGVNHGCIT
jgi:hypothetical protein